MESGLCRPEGGCRMANDGCRPLSDGRRRTKGQWVDDSTLLNDSPRGGLHGWLGPRVPDNSIISRLNRHISVTFSAQISTHPYNLTLLRGPFTWHTPSAQPDHGPVAPWSQMAVPAVRES